MQTPTATRTDRESFEAMVRIETRNLDWQRSNDATYAEIEATMWRIHELNMRIAGTVGVGMSSYATNSR